MGVLAKATWDGVSPERDETVQDFTRLLCLCVQCLNPNAVVSLRDINLPSTHLVPAVGEYGDAAPLCCHSAKDAVFRYVYLNGI